MKINKVGIGNLEEAFVEEAFSNGINIISSDDNNRGKTILIQSMMYALGNEPTFPSSFEYKKYYHYIEFEVNNTVYHLCRRNSGFVLKYNSVLMIFDSVSELKRYWSKHVFKLPCIIKQQITKIVDPVLFLQLFFVGQDKKDTATISQAGYYNKQDFYNMIFDICDANGLELDEEQIQMIKDKIKSLRDDKKTLLKQYDILKSTDPAVSYLSSANDRLSFEKKLSDLDKLRDRIGELRKARNAAATRKAKWETTLKELRSLNRNMDCGELRCMDCDSTNIAFSTFKRNSYTFDVSTVEMRNEIIESINETIAAYSEEMQRYSAEILKVQESLQAIMEDKNVTLESIVAYKQEIFSASDAEERIKRIEEQIDVLSAQLQTAANSSQSKKDTQILVINTIVQTMNDAYKQIDPTGNLVFDDIFTKKDVTYSGSEQTVFHLVKLYAIQKVLGHDYPIVVDSFRAEDLSTQKEQIVLDLFSALPNQVVFTTTLKTQELGKYDSSSGINHIDYSSHISSKMLVPQHVDRFSQLMTCLSITL